MQMKYKDLIGSGDKIILTTAPVAIFGLFLDSKFPSLFTFSDPGQAFRYLVTIILIFGIFFWLWSVYLIITIATKDKLITKGPFAFVKHPIYTSVGLLVIPFAGLLLHSWLGVVIGVTLYLASLKFAPEEEKLLAKTFGENWKKYIKKVKLPWL